MRVLLIDVNCKSGSTGKIVYDLFSEINRTENVAAICYGRGKKIVENGIFKFGIDIETYMHAFLTRLTGLTGYFSFFSTQRLLKYIKKFKPDAVHIHELHAYFVNIKPIISYLKKNNIKTIWTFHCEFMYTGKCGHSFECDKWKIECGKCPNLKDYPKSLKFDFTRKMFNDKRGLFEDFDNLTIVTPSQWLADRVKESFLKDKDIKVIHNGIDIENIFHSTRFDEIKLKHDLNDEKIILAVAPDIMSKRKGGSWVVKLSQKFLNCTIKFILIGVEDLAEKFDDNIIAIGRTDNQVELAKYYSMADVFVICSERENFPTTCIEAISCGTPICGFDTGGTRETAPAQYGSFVKYGDLDSLEKEVRRFLQVNIKTECESYGKSNYDKKKMFSKYLKLYGE